MEALRANCNLSDEAFDARRKQLREELLPRVRGRGELINGIAVRFDATPEVRQELDAFIRFERDCCPGLDFSLRETAGELHLEIRGYDPDASDLRSVGRTSGLGPFRRQRWLPWLRAAGLGAAGALLLCCLLPLGLVALLGFFGLQQPGSLGAFDNPWAISISAVGLAALFLRREQRLEASRVPQSGCGC